MITNVAVSMSAIMRGQRLQIMLTEEELQALDDWRFARRMPSRASAIRELLKRGLNADGFDHALADQKSKHFGVMSASKPRRKATLT